VSLSNTTTAFFAQPFWGGDGSTHATIDFIWNVNGASQYVLAEAEANKQTRVLYGLR
jgi:hypothetical protein